MNRYTTEHVNWKTILIRFIFHLNGNLYLYPNFNYSRSKCQPFVSTYRISDNLQDSTYLGVLQNITVHINLSQKHRLFHERI